jgi:hypothetical protein
VAPTYLLTKDLTWIVTGFIIQGFFGGALQAIAPCYLAEPARGTARGLITPFSSRGVDS